MPSPKTITFVPADGMVDKIDSLIPERGLNRSEVIRSLIEEEGRSAQYVWIAYYPDYSAIVPFADEKDALRHAVRHSMEVIPVPYGISVQAADQARFDQARRAG